MPSVYHGSVVESLGQLFATGTATSLSESKLLERFVAHGDQAAFEAILQRHGVMVLRVCQRVLTDPNDVDDAFQATFLILVKKGASIRDGDALAMWLYGVARRVAVRARVSARRRRLLERTGSRGLSAAASRAHCPELSELQSVIDEELERLPARYRGPVVLCDLGGQTNEQAAAALRCPVGTVKSRLSRGRERLRARLLRRGVAPDGSLASVVTGIMATRLPCDLVSKTLRLGTALAAKKAVPASPVASLVNGFVRSMFVARLKLAAVMIAAIAVGVTSFGTLMFAGRDQPTLVFEQASAQAPPKIDSAPKADNVARAAEPGSERYVLDNNDLTVILRPIKGASSTALVVLYKIGSDHDPEGRSGAAHMLEHTYMTAASGQSKARTVEELAARYPLGSNAQTGDRYTAFGTVFPPADIEGELKDAASRMEGGIWLDDIARERPRVLAEIDNMFDNIPALAAVNQARELVRPTPCGGRRGGLPAFINSVYSKELMPYRDLSYYPGNAILAVAGAFEPATVRKRINKYFNRITRRPFVVPPGAPPGPAKLGGEIKEVKVQSRFPDSKSIACIAYPAPSPGSELYAPFLVLVSRLWASADTLGDDGPTGSPVYFTPLDDGAIVAISAQAKPGEGAPRVFERIESFLTAAIAPNLRPFELMIARQQIGPLLGLVDVPDIILANNPYGVALSLARRDQLNLSSTALRRDWDRVNNDQLHHAASAVFARDRQARVFVAVEK